MYNSTQIVKGILEGCILKIIESETLYGYRIVERLNMMGFQTNEATVYPILARLSNQGCLTAEKKPSSLGPMRKYYSLTPVGESYLEAFAQAWNGIKKVVDRVMEGEVND